MRSTVHQHNEIDLSSEKSQNESQIILTSKFQLKLLTKLSSFDAINKSIRSFNLIHSKGEPIDLSFCSQPGFDFFDSKGEWNTKAHNVDENSIENNKGDSSTYDHHGLVERLNEILYPNILSEDVKISVKEKTILCAIIYDVQTQLLSEYMPEMNQEFDEDAFRLADQIKYMIYTAARSAVTNIISELGNLISYAESEARAAKSLAAAANTLHTADYKLSGIISWGFAQKSTKGTEREPLVMSIQEKQKDDGCKCSIF